MKIAFLGLGNMGLPMARQLLRAGHSLSVWNRSRGRAEQLAAEGARVAATPAQAATNVEVAVTMLADDHAVRQTMFAGGLLNSLAGGAVHVSMSTISVQLARELAEAHAGRGQLYVSAPVFGRPEAAAAARLAVVAAGPPAALAAVQPLFDAVGQRTFVLGDEPAAANVVKLAGNFMIASVLECLGEAFALVRKHGVVPQQFLEVITSTLFNAPVYKTYGALIAEQKFSPAGFRLALGLKDVKLALAAAEATAVPMPVASVVRDHLLSGVARGMADDDWSALARIVAESAGLP